MNTSNENGKRLDPETFEVLHSSFEYVCGRMSTVLQKAAFSPIIYDMVDFSNAIYNERLELLGQTANCPVHIAAMHFSAQASVKHFGFESLRPGDIFVLNDPYDGGTHLNDMTFTMPVFFDGDILGFAVSRGHWTDVGGGAAGGQAFGTHIAGEGLRLPPLRVEADHRCQHAHPAIHQGRPAGASRRAAGGRGGTAAYRGPLRYRDRAPGNAR